MRTLLAKAERTFQLGDYECGSSLSQSYRKDMPYIPWLKPARLLHGPNPFYLNEGGMRFRDVTAPCRRRWQRPLEPVLAVK